MLTPRNAGQGCSKDCNPLRNVTKIDINLKDMIASSNGLPLAHSPDGSVVPWDFKGIEESASHGRSQHSMGSLTRVESDISCIPSAFLLSFHR